MACEREQRLRSFSLYAQAKVAWQLGGDMRTVARSHALAALELLEKMERPGREQRMMLKELKEYIK